VVRSALTITIITIGDDEPSRVGRFKATRPRAGRLFYPQQLSVVGDRQRAFARRFERCLPQKEWQMIELPTQTYSSSVSAVPGARRASSARHWGCRCSASDPLTGRASQRTELSTHDTLDERLGGDRAQIGRCRFVDQMGGHQLALGDPAPPPALGDHNLLAERLARQYGDVLRATRSPFWVADQPGLPQRLTIADLVIAHRFGRRVRFVAGIGCDFHRRFIS